MLFESVDEATRIWIKGREFSVARLLGDAYKDEASKFVGGALGIFRLAPQVSEATLTGPSYIRPQRLFGVGG